MVRCPFLHSFFVETVSNKALQPIRFWHVDESVIERVVIWTFAGGGHFRFGTPTEKPSYRRAFCPRGRSPFDKQHYQAREQFCLWRWQSPTKLLHGPVQLPRLTTTAFESAYSRLPPLK